MPTTIIDLCRRGNATSPRLSRVRIPKDIPTLLRDGEEWVEARSGGVSTFSSRDGGQNWWKLLNGSPYADTLVINNDHGNHYNWEPAVDMLLSQFVDTLRDVEKYFARS